MNLVITGASSGIGHFLADGLAKRGHEVCRVARSPLPGFSCQCDVSDWRAVRTCAAKIAARFSALDGLVCCAGIQEPIGLTMKIDPQAWERNLAVNLSGTLFVIQALYPLLRKSTLRSKVVCFSGGGATSPRPNFTAYGVAKTGVVRLVETLAAEWHAEPIDINAVAPGAIFTKMTKQILESGADLTGQREFESASLLPQDNTGKLENVLGLVELLISPQSDGISGRLISAPWDPWQNLPMRREELMNSDIYTLRRILPEDRGKEWKDS